MGRCAVMSTDMRKAHILIVDDDERIVCVLGGLLEHLGYQVTAYTNSVASLEEFRSRPRVFNLVITDLMMPQLDGLELSAAMMSLRPDLPIIMCTGSSNADSEEKAKRIGIHEYLHKPVTIEELLHCISRIQRQWYNAHKVHLHEHLPEHSQEHAYAEVDKVGSEYFTKTSNQENDGG